jgi:plastocyanin
LNNVSNANFTLERGKTYTFQVDTPGHPFIIKSVQGTGTANAYNDGVTNNGISKGEITFTVPADAPSTLFYNCEFHVAMTGTITIMD